MSKNLVKQDLNFLEYPMWSISAKQIISKNNVYIFKDGEYQYTCMSGQPKSFDIKLLNFLLLCSQQNSFSTKIEFIPNVALKFLQYPLNGYYYSRVKQSLEKWKKVIVTFKRFYQDQLYVFSEFNILDSYDFCMGSKNIEIKFGEKWINKIKKSKFFKDINLNVYMKIRQPIALRMFEILEKNLAFRKQFIIGTYSLAHKIWTDEEIKKYKRGLFASDVIEKIRKSVDEINQHLLFEKEKNYSFDLSSKGRGEKSKITFHKVFIKDNQKDIQPVKVPTISLNPGSKLSPELQEVSDWMKFHNVSEKGIKQLIRSCGKKNILHDFPYIKDVYSCGKKAPGWIVCAFKERYFKDKPEYNDEEFIMEEWQQEMFST